MDNDNLLFEPLKIIINSLLILLQIIILVLTILNISKIASYIFWISWVLSIMCTLSVIYKKEKASYKTSWVIFILGLPIFGSITYLWFGRKHIPRRIKNRMSDVENKKVYEIPKNERLSEKIYDKYFKNTIDMIYRIAGYPIYQNTSVKYFKLGDEMFADMMVDIKNAKKFIFLEYYILKDGEMYKELIDALIVKAQEGLEIIILYDAMGSFLSLPKRFKKSMDKYNIKCYSFNDLRSSVYDFVSFRDHRKITVVDGNIGYCGGINIGDEYINHIERFGHWKDMAVRLEGDAVWSLTIMFLKMFEFIQGKEKQKIELYKPTVSHKYEKGYVIPYADGPTNFENPGESVYRKMISSAKDYLYITTPYLILDDEVLSGLCLSAKSGVDVRIIIPHIPDKKIAFKASNAYYNDLISSGVRIYEYTPGFMHGKTFVADDIVGIVGSINLDSRSLTWNYECATLFYDCNAVFSLRDDFLETTGISEEITLEKIKNPKFIKRLSDSILRILSPLL